MEQVASFDYPSLSSCVSVDDTESCIIQLFFMLCRQQHLDSFDELTTCVRRFLEPIRIELDKHNPLPSSFSLFITMIAYTRDFYLGKGDRTVSYYLLMELYTFFPNVAWKLFLSFVYDRYDEEHSFTPSYGSWKDINYMCDFLKHYSKEGVQHPMINQIVQLVNDQLMDDIGMWKRSIHPRDRNYITQVAKWIPREHKKFHWLFEKLVVDYIQTNHPQWLNTAATKESYEKALNKGRKNYRKMVSLLNKGLKTFEISQCKQELDTYSLANIPKMALTKQHQIRYGKYGIKTGPLSLHRQWKDSSFVTSSLVNTGRVYSSFEPAFFVKEALYISNITDPEEKALLSNCLQAKWDKQTSWMNECCFESILPLVDISQRMFADNKSHLYQAIGMGVALSWYSKGPMKKRLMCFSSLPLWINYNHCDSLVDAITLIFTYIQHNGNTSCPYHKCFSFLLEACVVANSTRSEVRSMKWVFFSRLSNDFDSCIQTFLQCVSELNCYMPVLCYWNISTNAVIDINEHTNNEICVCSGVGFPLLRSLSYITTIPNTMNIIRRTILQPRYKLFFGGHSYITEEDLIY